MFGFDYSGGRNLGSEKPLRKGERESEGEIRAKGEKERDRGLGKERETFLIIRL